MTLRLGDVEVLQEITIKAIAFLATSKFPQIWMNG